MKGRTRGRFSHDAPKGAARRGRIPFFSVVVRREKNGHPNRLSSLDHPDTVAYAILHQILQPLLIFLARSRGVGQRRCRSTTFFNHNSRLCHCPTRGSFGSNASLSVRELSNGNSGISFLRSPLPFAPVANRSCQQRGGSGLFERAYAAPAVDKPD